MGIDGCMCVVASVRVRDCTGISTNFCICENEYCRLRAVASIETLHVHMADANIANSDAGAAPGKLPRSVVSFTPSDSYANSAEALPTHATLFLPPPAPEYFNFCERWKWVCATKVSRNSITL